MRARAPELSVLRIVHVACRLADLLGYDVVKPLVQLSVDEVIAELPPKGRQSLVRDPEELLKRIDERIREFSGENAEFQPEEALALVANATAAAHQTALPLENDAAQAEEQPAAMAELPMEFEPLAKAPEADWTRASAHRNCYRLGRHRYGIYWLLK